MVRLRPIEPSVPHYSWHALLDWIREVAPDLRIMYRLDGDRRMVGARYTLRGVERTHYVSSGKQPDGSTVEDIDEALVRHIYRVIARELGLPNAVGPTRTERERAIIAASARGDTETAEKLARELAASNETEARRRLRLRTSFGTRVV